MPYAEQIGVVIRRGSLWWVDLGDPKGSEPGFGRPGLVISADTYNRSAVATVVVVILTSNLRLGKAPGNVTLAKGIGGLAKASVVNVTQVATVDKKSLIEPIGEVDDMTMDIISRGLRRALTL